MTRRDFIGRTLVSLGFAAHSALSRFALASLGGCAGGFLFAAPKGWTPASNPNLVFGVVSDTHLRTAWNGRSVDKNYTDRYFVAALKYFREQHVDAVMHLGDLANNGQVEAMQFHADAWRKVFPEDRGIDGRKVERLFVTGNHDVEGFAYGQFMERLIGDPEERKNHLLATDMAANWERIWGEPYEEAWHKTVNGYHFFGQHYPIGAFDAGKTAAVVNACRTDATLDNEVRPVFLLTHRRPHLSAMNRAVGPLANALGFHGHWHKSATNWNVIGVDDNRFPHVQCPACHSSRGESFAGIDGYISKAPVQGGEWKEWKSRQGYVVKVYEDMLVIERHEFDKGVASLGPDWVMPLGKRDPHPFAKEELKKVIGEPQFSKSGKLRVESVKLESGEKAVKISIPLADGNPDSRVYAYEVVVIGEAGNQKLFKAVYATGCNMGIGREPNGGVTTLEIPTSELPPGEALTVAVRPLTSLGTSGRPIITDFKV